MSVDYHVVGVAGFGTMGAGVAQVAASGGSRVVIFDPVPGALEQGRARLERFVQAGVKREVMSATAANELLHRISGTLDISEFSECSLIVECVTEDEEIKRGVLEGISSVVASDAVMATNTSSLSVTALAASVQDPHRFAGLHFFNPAPLMPLVEVVPGLLTSSSVVEALSKWVGDVGKESIVVKDQPGFLVNALFIPYMNQAIEEYDNGLASAEDMDKAIRLGLGYPQGPLELLDRLGLDTHLLASTRAYNDTAEKRYAPPPLLQRLVAAGRLGSKSGQGIRPSDGET